MIRKQYRNDIGWPGVHKAARKAARRAGLSDDRAQALHRLLYAAGDDGTPGPRSFELVEAAGGLALGVLLHDGAVVEFRSPPCTCAGDVTEGGTR